ncbi:conserved hypothetical protein [Gammaproteobacteria bacterium]
MANYATLADCTDDPLIPVQQIHLDRANLYVETILRNRGINPGEITSSRPILTDLAVYQALRLAAISQITSGGNDDQQSRKASEYGKLVKEQTEMVTRAALGLVDLEDPASAGSGIWGSIALERD